MREILFRGKRVDNGEWVEGDVHKNIDFSKAHIHPNGERVRSFDVLPETVGQYTGLTDKNGVKIFEGDIVRAVTQSTKIYIEAVTFKNGAFWYKNWSWFKFQFKFENVEVIGNIYDNSELLEG